MKEVFIYIICENSKFYITDRKLDITDIACLEYDRFDEFVGSYKDKNKLI